MSEEEIAKAISEIPGDSLLAVGDSQMMKIHYHTNVPWKVLELCSTIGEIYDIIVEDMERPVARPAGLSGNGRGRRRPRPGVYSEGAGDGGCT